MDLTEADLAALAELNRLRALGPSPRRDQLEYRFSVELDARHRLAVYGSLAPGRKNHHQIAALAGTWEAGLAVTGEKLDRGWGAALGYPALRWAPAGERVEVQLFVSRELPDHWQRLDAFEGDEYLRIVVPVYAGERVTCLANLYGAR